MKKEWLVKTLATGIIFIFLSTTIQPVISTTTIQDDKLNLVEVIVSTCKFNKIENHKLVLKQQQADMLDILFNDLRVKLDNILTVKDIVEIYYEMIESLYKIGLIPKCINLEEAKQLVTEKKPKLNSQNIENIVNNLEDNENIFCQINGQTSYTCFFSMIGRNIWFLNIRPIAISNTICYGVWPWPYEYKSGFQGKTDPPTHWYPASGYVYTNGLNGNISWNGEFYGQLSSDYYTRGFSYTVAGVKDFRGFHFSNFKAGICYYFGYAKHVKLGYKQPADPPWP